jgi:hypothetical protein
MLATMPTATVCPHSSPLTPYCIRLHPLPRCEELRQPYDEAQVRLLKGRQPLREDALAPGQQDFATAVRGPASGVFAREPEYWQTVHLGGDGWEAALAEKRRLEKEAWRGKVCG